MLMMMVDMKRAFWTKVDRMLARLLVWRLLMRSSSLTWPLWWRFLLRFVRSCTKRRSTNKMIKRWWMVREQTTILYVIITHTHTEASFLRRWEMGKRRTKCSKCNNDDEKKISISEQVKFVYCWRFAPLSELVEEEKVASPSEGKMRTTFEFIF